MRNRTEIELKQMEGRLNGIPMYESERIVAIGAMYKGYIIVEQFATLARKIMRIGATLFSKQPRLAS